jgi:hypothetical protein
MPVLAALHRPLPQIERRLVCGFGLGLLGLGRDFGLGLLDRLGRLIVPDARLRRRQLDALPRLRKRPLDGFPPAFRAAVRGDLARRPRRRLRTDGRRRIDRVLINDDFVRCGWRCCRYRRRDWTIGHGKPL